MSNFNIDDEIDRAVDKMADQLKARLKKLVVRSEKQVLRQYIASQKVTKAATRSTGAPHEAKKAPARRTVPKREEDYRSSSGSDSDSLSQ